MSTNSTQIIVPEDQLKTAIFIVERFLFPSTCSIAVLCNLLIILAVKWTKVKRASKLYLILVAASDILQALALTGFVERKLQLNSFSHPTMA